MDRFQTMGKPRNQVPSRFAICFSCEGLLAYFVDLGAGDDRAVLGDFFGFIQFFGFDDSITGEGVLCETISGYPEYGSPITANRVIQRLQGMYSYHTGLYYPDYTPAQGNLNLIRPVTTSTQNRVSAMNSFVALEVRFEACGKEEPIHEFDTNTRTPLKANSCLRGHIRRRHFTTLRLLVPEHSFSNQQS